MKTTVETTSPIERKLSIEVEPERVAAELDRAYTALGRRVTLRGFRPGHVPRHVLERTYRAEVEGEVVEKVVQSSFTEAATAEGIEPVAPPQVSIEGAIAAGVPLRFSARVEVRPRIEPKEWRGLAVTRPAATVTDELVAAELLRLQEAHAQLEPVEGREVAEEGDWAVVDHVGTIDGAPFEGSTAEGVTVRVSAGSVEDGHLPVLAGRRIGESAEFDEPFPAEHRNPALRGRTAHVKVTLRALKAKRSPELDDAFAARVGVDGVETLEALRARLRADLEKRESRRAEGEFRDALVKAALARNEFEVPPSLVERAIDTMLEGTAERFARMGVDLAQLELDVARLRADLREQALLQVRGGILLDAIATAEGVQVTEEDLAAEAGRLAAEMGVPLQKVQKQLRGKDARAALESRVREEKAFSLLAQAATVQS